MSSTTSDRLNRSSIPLPYRAFLISLGILFAGSGVFLVYDTLQRWSIWQTIAGLFFSLIGCLMVYAGMSRRTEIRDNKGSAGYFGD